jgi:eukaryotic-like serine/threonine-protein kinase
MALISGTKLGPYEIQSQLGAGGMGEVYRALDTRLNRTVAIKVLPAHLSSSAELKQRMEREARAISSLNHPHICQLYDIGSHQGTQFLVMEFLEGETLAQRLRKGPMPLHEVYKIGIAVAQALEVAHRQGIVHRDLKPGNIMLTPAGAKLMDFGLAKPVGLPTGSASGPVPSFTAAATISGASPLTPLTTAGSIVGTIQYMSPEQIEGKEADTRSDIFALGAVLYEMAAGKRPFDGKSQISLASSILEKDPEPISAIQPVVPPAFDHVVATCLQKNPEDRYQTAHDIKLELQWIASDKSKAPATAAAPSTAESKRRTLPWLAALAAALLLGGTAGFFLRRFPAAPSTRTLIDPPENTTLNLSGDYAGPPVLSPDGTMLAFTATGADGKASIWVRPMNSLQAHPLADTTSATFPFWSPDSRSLAFFADGKLKTIEVNSGSAQVVCNISFGRGGTWGSNGVIIFSPGPEGALMQVSAAGGTPTPATTIDMSQQTSHRWPFFLPDGKHFLYAAINHDPSKSANDTLYYGSLNGKENRALFHSHFNAVFASGYLVFGRNDQVMAQPFDPSNGKLSGEPQGLATGALNDTSTWHMGASASNNGLLALGSGGSADRQLIWLDRATKQITTAEENLENLLFATISPQGDRAALQISSGQNDIWVLDFARRVRTRLTFGPVGNTFPVWSPDGKWIAFFSLRNSQFSIVRKPSDGSGEEEILTVVDQPVELTDWSQDGKFLLYSRADTNGFATWALPLQGERKPFLVVPRGRNGRFSPDGRWLAYQSAESGNVEVYVVAFGGGQGKWQVSANVGSTPRWSKDGKELFFRDGHSALVAVPVREVPGALQFGTPQSLVTQWSVVGQPFFDVAPDGKKILLDRMARDVSQSVTVVTNFTAELKAKR